MNTALVRRKDVFSWCLYDWADSAFVTSVVTVVLPVYFLTLVPQDGPVLVGVGRWQYATSGLALFGYITAAYMFAAAVSAPILGAVADHTRSKKRFLAVCVVVGALLTCAVWTVSPGQYQLCAVFFVGAAFMWSCANLFYDALLPGLSSTNGEMDTISTTGYALGYLGGGVLLALNLAMVTKPEWFGFSDSLSATRAVFLTVGLWWVVFSIPVLRNVREDRLTAAAGSMGNPVTQGFRRLFSTLRKVRRYRQLVRLLIAFVLYNTGIGTVIVVAVPYGRDELGISTETLIACILLIQFVGFPATFGFIVIAGRLGTRAGILLGLAVYVGVVVFAFFMTTAAEFCVLGVLVGLVQGGTQALSRSLYASMIPAGHSAEFFGFFSVFNKVGSFVGPLCFGIVRDATDSARTAIVFIAVFFVVGGLVLLLVDVREGRGVGAETPEM